MCCSRKNSPSFLAASGSSGPLARNASTSSASEPSRAFVSGSSSSSVFDSGKNSSTVVASGTRKAVGSAPSLRRSFSARSTSMELECVSLRSTPIFRRVSKRKPTLTPSSRASSLSRIWIATVLPLFDSSRASRGRRPILAAPALLMIAPWQNKLERKGVSQTHFACKGNSHPVRLTHYSAHSTFDVYDPLVPLPGNQGDPPRLQQPEVSRNG